MKPVPVAAITALTVLAAACGEKHEAVKKPAGNSGDATGVLPGAQAAPLSASFKGETVALPYVRVSNAVRYDGATRTGITDQIVIAISDDAARAGCVPETLPAGPRKSHEVRMTLPKTSATYAIAADAAATACNASFQVITIDPKGAGPLVAADVWPAGGKLELSFSGEDDGTVHGAVTLTGADSSVSGAFVAPFCAGDFDQLTQRDLPCGPAN